MRFSIFFVGILLAVVYQCHSQSDSTTKPAGWSFDKNYEVEDPPNNNNNYNSTDDDDGYDNYPSNDYSSGRTRRAPDEYGKVNLYFRTPSKKGGSYSKPKKTVFPAVRYDRKHAPPFSPLISFAPWLPIFVHRRSKQTVIFSPIGGVYIIPPVINFYGKMFAVGELIASGYCSLVSSGAPPPPGVDVAPLVKPGTVAGPGIPPVNTNTGGFTGGVKTDYRSFGPKY